jgi:hypothetical protein
MMAAVFNHAMLIIAPRVPLQIGEPTVATIAI